MISEIVLSCSGWICLQAGGERMSGEIGWLWWFVFESRYERWGNVDRRGKRFWKKLFVGVGVYSVFGWSLDSDRMWQCSWFMSRFLETSHSLI